MRIPRPFAIAVEANSNALTDITGMRATDAHALEQQIAEREAFRPDQIVSGKSSILGPFNSRLDAALGASSSILSGLYGAGGCRGARWRCVRRLPLNAHLENDLAAIAAE